MSLQQKGYRSQRNVILQHMEATLELSEHKQKSGKVVSSGPQFVKTPENLFKGADDVSCMEASLLATQCPSHTTSKLNYLMSGVLISWGPFLKSHDCEYILVAVDYVSK